MTIKRNILRIPSTVVGFILFTGMAITPILAEEGFKSPLSQEEISPTLPQQPGLTLAAANTASTNEQKEAKRELSASESEIQQLVKKGVIGEDRESNTSAIQALKAAKSHRLRAVRKALRIVA